MKIFGERTSGRRILWKLGVLCSYAVVGGVCAFIYCVLNCNSEKDATDQGVFEMTIADEDFEFRALIDGADLMNLVEMVVGFESASDWRQDYIMRHVAELPLENELLEVVHKRFNSGENSSVDDIVTNSDLVNDDILFALRNFLVGFETSGESTEIAERIIETMILEKIVASERILQAIDSDVSPSFRGHAEAIVYRAWATVEPKQCLSYLLAADSSESPVGNLGWTVGLNQIAIRDPLLIVEEARALPDNLRSSSLMRIGIKSLPASLDQGEYVELFDIYFADNAPRRFEGSNFSQGVRDFFAVVASYNSDFARELADRFGSLHAHDLAESTIKINQINSSVIGE